MERWDVVWIFVEMRCAVEELVALEDGEVFW